MLTLQGYDIRSEQEYYDAILANIKTVFPTINEDKANYAIVMARMFARNEARRDQEIADLYNAAYVSTATGYSLDKAVWAAGLMRDNGDYATGKILITKSTTAPSMIISAFSELIVDNKIYITQNATTITETQPSIEIDIKSKEIGTLYNIPDGIVLKFVVPNVNVSSIVTSTDIIGGANLETDEALRARYFAILESSKNSSLPSIVNQVKSVNGVTHVTGRENIQDVQVGTMLPHSVEISVLGGTDNDVATMIANAKAGGIATSGTTETVVSIDGVDYTIKFIRIQGTSVYYTLTVVVDKNATPQNIIDIINSSVIEFTKGKDVIRKWDLDADISQSDDSIIGVYSSLFGLTSNPSSSTDLVADVGFKFDTDVDKILITIIEE